MAANLNHRGLVSVGKHFINQIRTRTSSVPAKPASLTFRAVHESVYDKNIDAHVRPAFVPYEFTRPEFEKYWAPDSKTGVFDPVSGKKSDASSNTSSGEESVLEQKAFFRPLEDLDKLRAVNETS